MMHIIVGKVTCPDVAGIFSAMVGRTVKLGDPEYRVLDHPVNPGPSADFPTRDMAILFVVQQRRKNNG